MDTEELETSESLDKGASPPRQTSQSTQSEPSKDSTAGKDWNWWLLKEIRNEEEKNQSACDKKEAKFLFIESKKREQSEEKNPLFLFGQ